MNLNPMDAFGMALRAYFEGNTDAELIFRRDDGQVSKLPVRHFFRELEAFRPIEKTALAQCAGHVLDLGAGTGIHSLALQELGFKVTAIDINSNAVEIMKRRGVKSVQQADSFAYHGDTFDTLLLMGHGIGFAGTIAGLDRFLGDAPRLLRPRGQMLLDSFDVRVTDDPGNLAYHESNRQSGRYIGEIRMQIEYQDQIGPYFGWLHVDAETLKEHAHKAGWQCEVLLAESSGEYLARLTRESSP